MAPGIRIGGVRAALVAVALLGSAVPGMLSGCGGGSDGAPAYALVIDAPLSPSTTASDVTLSGSGFLPPESSCGGGCNGPLPPPVYGQLGPNTLGWHNQATGETGVLGLTWVCNCGGNAPYWIGRIPLAPGANLITVTMTAGDYRQSASVSVTRV